MLLKFLLVVSSIAARSAWCAAAADAVESPPSARYSVPISTYGGGGGSNNAQAIPLSALVPATLNQLYGPDSQVALSLNFAQQPDRWDPYNANNQSEFVWRYTGSPTTLPADNAYVELTGVNGPYANNRRAALLSAPFQRWQPLNDTNPAGLQVSPYDEGVLRWTKSIKIDSTQRALFRLVLKCKIFRAQNHPFPPQFVSHPNDDPRFANCFIVFEPYTVNASSSIYVLVTNKSIWGVYQTAVSISKRRIGIRQSYDAIVDVGLGYDAPTNTYTFYVRGEPVWIITQPGLRPTPDGNTKTDTIGTGGPGVAETTPVPEFGIRFGTHKCLDESDPWNQTDTTLLVRQSNDPAMYAPDAVFYDNTNARSNNLWDQTVKMGLISAVVESSSGAVQPTPVGGQQQSPYAAAAAADYQPSSGGGGNYGK